MGKRLVGHDWIHRAEIWIHNCCDAAKAAETFHADFVKETK